MTRGGGMLTMRGMCTRGEVSVSGAVIIVSEAARSADDHSMWSVKMLQVRHCVGHVTPAAKHHHSTW